LLDLLLAQANLSCGFGAVPLFCPITVPDMAAIANHIAMAAIANLFVLPNIFTPIILCISLPFFQFSFSEEKNNIPAAVSWLFFVPF